MSLENTTKENFFTPVPTVGKYADEDDDTIDTSTEATDEEEKDDLGNATEFHEYMKAEGHVFKTCKNKLLWYDPKEGVYQEEDGTLKLKLCNLFSKSPVLEQKYKAAVSKHNALYSMLKTIVDPEPDFYKKSQENTKGFLAFNNYIWDFNERVPVPFDPKFYFTFKSRVNYKKHDSTFEKEVFKMVCESIFGEGEKSEFFMKLLARALAGEVKDKRFIVLLGETNSGKGTLTQLLGDCFGLGSFIGNYDAKNLQTESATKSWLLQNKNSRIILANEINAEKPILLHNIKWCANGGEPITATAKYVNEINFIPQGTMLLFANEMPPLKGDDAGGAVENRMVYVETEYSYLKQQEYDLKKDTNPNVRLGDPSLKDDYLKRPDVQEAFARLICKAYEPEAPPLPKCCVKKALEYTPKKSLKKRLEEVVDITGDENDFVFAAELKECLSDANATSLGIEMKKFDGVTSVKERFGTPGIQKVVYRGVKWREENTTQEYEDDTSPEVSFADVDTVMTSPIKKNGEVVRLTAKIAELELALKAKEQVPEGCDKALKTCLETKSETVKTATMKKAVEGVLKKNKQLEETLAEYRQTLAQLEAEQIDQLQRETEAQDENMGLCEMFVKEEKKNKDLTTFVKQVERQTKTKVLDDDGGVLPDVLKRAKDVALVDTFDTD